MSGGFVTSAFHPKYTYAESSVYRVHYIVLEPLTPVNFTFSVAVTLFSSLAPQALHTWFGISLYRQICSSTFLHSGHSNSYNGILIPLMAENIGFEPMGRLSPAEGLANPCNRPLCQFSKTLAGYRGIDPLLQQ